jgi:potassium voltage-gated channel Eag-related subfamily H member 8
MFLLVYFIIIEHISSCIWIMIGKIDQESKSNWIYKQGLVDSSNWDVYVTSMYFTFTTIITVGYGDISGVSNVEKFFCMGLMFLGGFMYSLLTGLLSTIV